MARSIDSETAAVILEPVQGEGGVRIPSDDYLPRVAELCKSKGALLIIDEIQTGFCRTGKFFGLQHSSTGVLPDLMTMGKGIPGGCSPRGYWLVEGYPRVIPIELLKI